jgi:hypothetical protein
VGGAKAPYLKGENMKSLEELETKTISSRVADEAQVFYDEIQVFDKNTAQNLLQIYITA